MPTALAPAALAAFTLAAAALAALFPAPLAAVSVFLFAGPHNWMEARYFAARMPARWGRHRVFFQTAIAGVVLLAPTFSLIPTHRPLWHTAAAGWVLILVRLAARSGAWADALPILASWVAGAWIAPALADLTLVFLHPIAALWFVKRQIARSHPDWTRAVNAIGVSIAPLAFMIVTRAPPGAGDPGGIGSLGLGFSAMPAAPSLIGLHAFLELLHYGAWIVVLPSLGMGGAPWDLRVIPLARSAAGARTVTVLFAAGIAAVVVLWAGFAIDYRTTYTVYFTLAIVHVLAEVPFLVRLR